MYSYQLSCFYTHTHVLHISKWWKIFFFGCLMWCSLGCDTQQHTTQSAASTFTLPTLQDGRLVFKSKEDFATISRLVVEGKLDFANSLPQRYMPLKKAFDTENPSELVKGLYKLPTSDYMQSFLNEKGEVQIGSSIFKITKDKVYEVSATNASVLDAPEAHLIGKTSAFLSVKEVNVTTSAMAGCPVGDEKFKRLLGYSYAGNYGVYAEVGVKTRYEQKDRKVLWWKEWDVSPTNVGHSYSGIMTVSHPIWGTFTHQVSGNYSSSTGELNTLIWSDSYFNPLQPGFVQGAFSATVQHSGNIFSCTSN